MAIEQSLLPNESSNQHHPKTSPQDHGQLWVDIDWGVFALIGGATVQQLTAWINSQMLRADEKYWLRQE